jgi:SNF2 family DNA or RNA helicase
LIFTQFVEMGKLLQRVLEKELGEKVFFLHGGVPKNQRDIMIKEFQSQDESGYNKNNIFILSLKAGGTGLNLTAANHVFHMDRWWNPAVENQATDRAYRIGQTRKVLVHKFITLGTLESRIDEMLNKKQNLNELIMGSGESWINEMSNSEIRQLFALRKDWIVSD